LHGVSSLQTRDANRFRQRTTAGQTIFGSSFRVTRERGKVLSSKLAPKVVATVHPSALLRQPDEMSRDREYARFVVDLRVALKAAGEG